MKLSCSLFVLIFASALCGLTFSQTGEDAHSQPDAESNSGIIVPEVLGDSHQRTVNESVTSGSHNSSGSVLHATPHDSEENKKPNYRNPFSYEPKTFVFVVIFVGALLMMVFVVGSVVFTRTWLCPRYAQWYESHPQCRRYLPKMRVGRRKGESGRGRRRRQPSATESHLELPKQDSLDNITVEIDNESFLASLENVNFSLTPPSVRRNFGPPPPSLYSHHLNKTNNSMTVAAPHQSKNKHRYGVSNPSTRNSGGGGGGGIDSDRESLYL